MKVLFLGYADSPLIRFLSSSGNEVVFTDQKLSPEDVMKMGVEFLVSYGYRYLIKHEILELFPRRAVNLHISFLPWNRGSDPNLWSFIDNTRKGVTIHLLDEGIDTGPIVAQKEVNFGENETLKSSYEILRKEIESLFISLWPSLKTGKFTEKTQIGAGSCHRKSDKTAIEKLLTLGWDTPVAHLKRW